MLLILATCIALVIWQPGPGIQLVAAQPGPQGTVENAGEVEPRFFDIKKKLCELGLAECNDDRLSELNYVQPVQVVPIGEPLPAVTLNKNYFKSQAFQKDKSAYTFNPVNTVYQEYSGAGYSDPNPGYYDVGNQNYQKKRQVNLQNFGQLPRPQQPQPARQNFQNNQAFVVEEFNQGVSLNRPPREGRFDECYCVPSHQCEPSRVLGLTVNKDYSNLIDPRNKHSTNITAQRRVDENEQVLQRTKRDGVGHHGGHGHGHGGHGQHSNGQPFGPNGIRPPTCGGQGSGYVCCLLQQVDFNEIGLAGNNRDVRQPLQVAPSPGFSSFGQCGKRNAHSTSQRINNPNQRVQQGDAEFGEYPWQAAILKKEQYDNVYVCGGSVIDNHHILTAAHCITKYRPEELRIRLGEWDVNNDSEFYPNIEFDVLSITVNPQFTPGNLYNDIALIKLDGSVDFQRNPHVTPVCLPDNFQTFTRQRCWVSGWGKDAFGSNGNYQNLLKEVDLPVLDDRDCELFLRRTRLGQDFNLHPGFVCAGGEEGKDACKGDGGGPLVCQDQTGAWNLVGIVSWGIGCGKRDVPGIYTKVNYYNGWIQEAMLQQ